MEGQEEDANSPREQAGIRKPVVVLVHGILTTARWMSDIKETLEEAGFVVVPTSYGKLPLWRFLFPGSWFRKAPIERIREQIVGAMHQYGVDEVSVIAHSFGTYVVAQIIAREPTLRWRRVILSGSVLPEDFPFGQYEQRFRAQKPPKPPILNEVGTKDFLPALAESVTWGYGYIGSHGLNNRLVENRWRKGLRHSDFLKPDFVRSNWIPFLKDGTFTKGDPSEISIPTRIFTAFPLKYVAIFAALFVYFAWPYVFAGPDDPPENIAACGLYRESTRDKWIADNFLPPESRSYYVLVASGFAFQGYPTVHRWLAQLEALRLNRRYPHVYFEAIDTANPSGGNRQHAIALARGIPNKSSACKINEMARGCGFGDVPQAVYQLHVGWTRCDLQLSAEADCFPVIRDIDLGHEVDPNDFEIACVQADSAEKRQLALANLDEVNWRLQRLLFSQQVVFLPAMQRYLDEPSEAHWRAVANHADITRELAAAAIKSAIEYSGSLEHDIDPEVMEILGLTDHRIVMVGELLAATVDPLPLNEARIWLREYRELVSRLQRALIELKNRIESA